MAPATPPHPHATPLGIESVAFATGTGRLVRRATAVLFDPAGTNPKLSSAFDDATDDRSAVAHVLRTVVEADLDVAPFAIVTWTHDVELLVFGDIEMHTSCPSAPMITGAGSTTWVEHRIDRDLVDAGPSPQVWCGQPAEPGTNLRLGIAACDGFRLDLIVDPGVPESPSNDTLTASTTSPPITSPTPRTRPATVETEAVAPAPEVDEPAPSTAAAVPGDDTPALLSFDEPEPEPEAVVWTQSDELDNHDDDTDADPFALPSDDEAELAPAPAPPSAELLEFDSASGASAAPDIDHAPAPVEDAWQMAETAEQNRPRGMLIFDDRADLTILGTSVLGRRPQPDGDQLSVAIDHPEVSRTHAEIDTGTGLGQVATIRDLGSRNGTWVQSPGGAGLRRLDEAERALLLPGTIVHLGSVEVCFTWQPIDDE